MTTKIQQANGDYISPFDRIKKTNDAGMEFWSSGDFAGILGYGDYRNFEGVVEKAKLACFNSGHRMEDHFVSAVCCSAKKFVGIMCSWRMPRKMPERLSRLIMPFFRTTAIWGCTTE